MILCQDLEVSDMAKAYGRLVTVFIQALRMILTALIYKRYIMFLLLIIFLIKTYLSFLISTLETYRNWI